MTILIAVIEPRSPNFAVLRDVLTVLWPLGPKYLDTPDYVDNNLITL